ALPILAGFLASAFAARNFSDRLVNWMIGLGSKINPDTLNTISVIVITLVLSYLTLVLGELVPKRIAMQKAEKIGKAFARTIYYISKVTAPLVWLLTVSTNGMLRLFGVNPHADRQHVTQEEIQIMVDLGEEKGTIAPEEGEMIDNVLELARTTAVEMMTPRTDLAVLWMSDTWEVWEQTICATSYSRYPVCREDMDDIAGILHVRDFLCGRQGDKNALLRPVYYVPETVRADVLMREMRQNKAHMAVVVDEYGGTSGVVTLEDVLEEIVGEIEDEHDDEAPYITEVEPGRWRARGSVDLSTLSETLGLNFPEGDYDTLGGLIFAQMSRIPKDGSHPEVDIAGAHIRVEALSEHRVEWAEITLNTDFDQNNIHK
ncbi:MAG: hemolysin family protein, partial [Eubacteriales bacterium]|nr:hemolysin family protein [Eubacteriales bacterium]